MSISLFPLHLFFFLLYVVHPRGQIWCRSLNVSQELGCPLPFFPPPPLTGEKRIPWKQGIIAWDRVKEKWGGEKKKETFLTVMSRSRPRRYRRRWGGGDFGAAGAIIVADATLKHERRPFMSNTDLFNYTVKYKKKR